MREAARLREQMVVEKYGKSYGKLMSRGRSRFMGAGFCMITYHVVQSSLGNTLVMIRLVRCARQIRRILSI